MTGAPMLDQLARIARPEAQIFADLERLCASPGFVHAIAYFSFRDNLIRFAEVLDAEAMESQHAPERLLRTEIGTLTGLLAKQPIDPTLPEPQRFQDYIDQAQTLLTELHGSMTSSWRDGFTVTDGVVSFQGEFWTGEQLREPIFYSGESAYGFQYGALAVEKYRADNPWLLANKGFEIEDAVAVANAASLLLSDGQMALSKSMRDLPPQEWTMLPGFALSVADIQARCDVSAERIEAVLEAFTPR